MDDCVVIDDASAITPSMSHRSVLAFRRKVRGGRLFVRRGFLDMLTLLAARGLSLRFDTHQSRG